MSQLKLSDDTRLLTRLFEVAVKAALPSEVVPRYMPVPPKGRTLVIGAGKGSALMAQAFEKHWKGPLSGLVITRYGHGVACSQIEIVEAAHPVPDEKGQKAAERIMEMVKGLSADDLVVCLISGGGSALMTLPCDGVDLVEKQALNSALLRSGASIDEINCVRKHLSKIKGGRLARACAPAKVVAMMISDVPGDDPSVIASGPMTPDPSTMEEARHILKKYRIEVPAAISVALANQDNESPKPGQSCFKRVEQIMVATPQKSLEAAAAEAKRLGLTPMILSDRIEGESREVAKVMAAIAKQVKDHHQPVKAPCVILSGGETTVSLRGACGGRGGPNQEFLLALAIELEGLPGVSAIACDTDGIDGSEDNAGAVYDPETLEDACARGLDAKAYLEANDSFGFFTEVDRIVRPGPTLTNVNDFRAILVR